MTERKNSVLTPTDREWVTGNYDFENVSRQAKDTRRESVESRTKSAVKDLQLLAENKERDHVQEALSELTIDEWDGILEAVHELHPEAVEHEHGRSDGPGLHDLGPTVEVETDVEGFTQAIEDATEKLEELE